MKSLIFLILLSCCTLSFGQQNDKISTIDFVQIVDNNKAEALYYFQNNWQVLRNMAIEAGYIHSYQFLETPVNEGEPFEFMLITTYLNHEQYKLREEHFLELINKSGDLKLLNDKQPADFRKTLFSKEMVRHLD